MANNIDEQLEDFMIVAMFLIVLITIVTCAVLSIINIRSANFSNNNEVRENQSYTEEVIATTDSMVILPEKIEGPKDTSFNTQKGLTLIPVEESNNK